MFFGGPRLLDFLLRRPDGFNRGFLQLPARFHFRRLLPQAGQVLFELGQPREAGVVGFLGQSLLLDLELHDPPLDHVDLGRQAVDLDAQPAARFVHQVDGLVRQEAIGDVPLRERRRGYERGVLDAHAVL